MEVVNNKYTLIDENYEVVDPNERDAYTIEDYKKFKKDKQIIKFKITGIDKNGNFKGELGNGITAFMPNSELYGKPILAKKAGIFLDKVCNVLIKKVDEKAKIVTVSQNDARQQVSGRVLGEIREALAKDETPIVDAVVRSYNSESNRVYVDIENCGLRGFIVPREWAYNFVEDINKASSYYIGKVIKVGILDIRSARRRIEVVDGKEVYKYDKQLLVCSRKVTLEDPWVGISKRYSKGDVCSLTCTDKQENKFYGRIDGLDDLDVYCFYPLKDIPIYEGARYRVVIHAVDEEKKLFSAKVQSMLSKPNIDGEEKELDIKKVLQEEHEKVKEIREIEQENLEKKQMENYNKRRK